MANGGRPQVGQRYRLKNSTLAIMKNGGRHTPFTVPGGGIVQVVPGPFDENRMVEVEWEGKTLLVFPSDLRERSEPIDEA